MRAKYKIGDYVTCQIYRGRNYRGHNVNMVRTEKYQKAIGTARLLIIGIARYTKDYIVLIEKKDKIKGDDIVNQYACRDYKIDKKYNRRSFTSVSSRMILGKSIKIKCKICRRIDFAKK